MRCLKTAAFPYCEKESNYRVKIKVVIDFRVLENKKKKKLALQATRGKLLAPFDFTFRKCVLKNFS